MRRIFVMAVVLFVFLGLSALPAVANRVVHRVSVGSADIAADANFSLVANEFSDGTVRGQWHDQFGGALAGSGVHVEIDCLRVAGNQAWVSGTIKTASGAFVGTVGQSALTQVADLGTTANDPPDQVSFTFINVGLTCDTAPGLPLFDLINGQAKVK